MTAFEIVNQTISTSFAITGGDSVANAIGTHAIWAVPAQGVTYDSAAGALISGGAPSAITLPEGWTGTEMVSPRTSSGTSLLGPGHRLGQRTPRSDRYLLTL